MNRVSGLERPVDTLYRVNCPGRCGRERPDVPQAEVLYGVGAYPAL